MIALKKEVKVDTKKGHLLNIRTQSHHKHQDHWHPALGQRLKEYFTGKRQFCHYFSNRGCR